MDLHNYLCRISPINKLNSEIWNKASVLQLMKLAYPMEASFSHITPFIRSVSVIKADFDFTIPLIEQQTIMAIVTVMGLHGHSRFIYHPQVIQ